MSRRYITPTITKGLCGYCGTETDDELCDRCKPIWGEPYREDDDRQRETNDEGY